MRRVRTCSEEKSTAVACPLVPRAQGWARARGVSARREITGLHSQTASAPLRHRARDIDGAEPEAAPLRAAPACESFRLCEAYVASLGLADGTLDAAGNRCYCRPPGSHLSCSAS